MSQSIYKHLFSEDLYHTTPGIVIVLAKKWEDYTPEHKTLLAKILGSVKVGVASVRIISQPTLALASLFAFSPSNVIVFGSQSEGINTYEITQAQGLTILKADDLPQLDDAKKKSLWLALKNMYNV